MMSSILHLATVVERRLKMTGILVIYMHVIISDIRMIAKVQDFG